jgi:hypothetical protein
MKWLKELWAKLVGIFKSFLMDAFTQAEQIVLAELKDFAVVTVKNLMVSDLSSADKRKAAFEAIKAEALKRGKTMGDSLVNVLVELALQYVKKNTPTA